MSVNSSYDVDSIGGGMGGMGGMGSNPLLWLITLGFLKDGGGLGGGNGSGAAGVLAGETQAKLDCLTQGQNALSNQIANAAQAERFNALSQQINTQGDFNRAATALVGDRVNDLKGQLSDCCCDIRIGQLGITNDIQTQTSILLSKGTSDTQRIVDMLSSQEVSRKDDEITRLNRLLQTAELGAMIAASHGGHGHGHGIVAPTAK